MKKFCYVLLGLFLVAWAFGVQAKDISVAVDMDAENSVQAKDKAMLAAQRQAFLETAGKMTDTENVEKLKELSDEQILHFVQSIGVANEKAGGTKYKADLTVSINDALLKDYLAENEMIKTQSTSLLVIPVYREQSFSSPLLWEDNNVWRKSWRSKGLIKFGTMQIVTIGEHFRSINGLNAEKALYMDGDLLQAISDMNGSDQIYVLYADTQQNGDLKVTIKNEKNKSEDSFVVYKDSEDDFMDKAIEKSVMFISNMERESQNSIGVEQQNMINVVYEYKNMKDWLMKSAEITKLSQVEGIDTNSFGGGKVNFVIKYSGALDDLWVALQEIGISHEAVGNYFVIR